MHCQMSPPHIPIQSPSYKIIKADVIITVGQTFAPGWFGSNPVPRSLTSMAYRGCSECHRIGATCDSLGPPCRTCSRSGKGEQCEYDVWGFVSQNPEPNVEQFGTHQQIPHPPPSLQCSQPRQSLPDALQSPNRSQSKVVPQAELIPCDLDLVSGSSKKAKMRKANAAASRRCRNRQRSEAEMEERISALEREKQSPLHERDYLSFFGRQAPQHQLPAKQSSLESSTDSVKFA